LEEGTCPAVQVQESLTGYTGEALLERFDDDKAIPLWNALCNQ